jgi:hypothetical protein
MPHSEHQSQPLSPLNPIPHNGGHPILVQHPAPNVRQTQFVGAKGCRSVHARQGAPFQRNHQKSGVVVEFPQPECAVPSYKQLPKGGVVVREPHRRDVLHIAAAVSSETRKTAASAKCRSFILPPRDRKIESYVGTRGAPALRFHTTGTTAGIQSKHATGLRLILGRPGVGRERRDMALPGLNLHQLKVARADGRAWCGVARYSNGACWLDSTATIGPGLVLAY